MEKPVTDISVDQDSDYVSERKIPDQVTCPLLQKIRSKAFKGNRWWQSLHLYAMWQTRSKLLATFWTICQGREMIIFFYILLLRTLSHLGVLPPRPGSVSQQPSVLFFSQDSNVHLWCSISAAHQNSYAKLQKSNWIQRMKRMASLQIWTFNKIILKKCPWWWLFYFSFALHLSFSLFPCVCCNSNYCQVSGCSWLWAINYIQAEVFPHFSLLLSRKTLNITQK